MDHLILSRSTALDLRMTSASFAYREALLVYGVSCNRAYLLFDPGEPQDGTKISRVAPLGMTPKFLDMENEECISIMLALKHKGTKMPGPFLPQGCFCLTLHVHKYSMDVYIPF